MRVFTSVFALAVFAAPASALAQTESPNVPTSGELVEQPREWDGDEVTFTGEVVGEAMVRGDYAWLHVNDDAYYLRNVEEGAELGGYNSGQAFWVPASLVGQIQNFGDYQHEGDVVRIRGTFNAACGEHGGDMDIHGTSLEVVAVGHSVVDPIHPWKIPVAIAMVLVAGLAYALDRALPKEWRASRQSMGRTSLKLGARLPRRRT